MGISREEHMLKTTKIKIIASLLPLCLIACGTSVKRPPVEGQVLSGSEASRVRIEVFSDLQCPACRDLFLSTLQPLMEDYQDDVSVVYYEFPLAMHKYARPAARYVAAAAKLGQHQVLSAYEAIFNDQTYWSSDGNLEDSVSKALFAEDFQKITKILQDADTLAEINETIEKELQFGKRKGVNSTPTMFISNGGREQKVEGKIPYQALKLFLGPARK